MVQRLKNRLIKPYEYNGPFSQPYAKNYPYSTLPVKMSYQDLNRKRIELGDLPGIEDVDGEFTPVPLKGSTAGVRKDGSLPEIIGPIGM